MIAKLRVGIAACLLAATAAVSGQIPDELVSFDHGGSSFGAAGAFRVTNADTSSTYWNPAGLGYVSERKASLTLRDKPRSRTRVTGSYAAPRRTTSGDRGATVVTHLGYATPYRNGTLGVSYTMGGAIDDIASAATLPVGVPGSVISNYREERSAQTDLLTVAFGTTTRSEHLALGAGLTFATNRSSYVESGTVNTGSWTPLELRSSGSGMGLIAGLQYVPPRFPNASIGLSYRSEIRLGGASNTRFLMDRIPARLSLGLAFRRDNFRSMDFLVIGAQVDRYFAGGRSLKFDRGPQTVFAVGAEYHYHVGNATVPIRVGYVNASSGGNEFGSRNAITYGIGYQPSNRQYSIDLGWSANRNGRTSIGIGATFRFK